MLGYEWGTHSPPPAQLILTDDHHHHNQQHTLPSTSSNHHRPIFDDPFSTPCTFPHDTTITTTFQPQHPNFPFFDSTNNDPRAFGGACFNPLFTALDPTLSGPTGFSTHHLVPKPEPEYTSRIGLNLGGRTYFAADDHDLVNRLYRRSRGPDSVNSPKCQAEGCNADLTHAKHYHRRHKVCEFHSKAATVVAAGLTQRFCQQCSRFHLLSEFDNGKRSCRKRLADHNRRRRKSNRDQRTFSHLENVSQGSPSDTGANSSSSVTVAISSPLGSFDSSFMQRSSD